MASEACFSSPGSCGTSVSASVFECTSGRQLSLWLGLSVRTQHPGFTRHSSSSQHGGYALWVSQPRWPEGCKAFPQTVLEVWQQLIYRCPHQSTHKVLSEWKGREHRDHSSMAERWRQRPWERILANCGLLQRRVWGNPGAANEQAFVRICCVVDSETGDTEVSKTRPYSTS